MKKLQAVLILMCAVGLSACGGGDEDAGSPTTFSTVPTEITVSGPNGTTCAAGFAGRVYIYGGTAPYRIDNTLPGFIAVTPPKVDNRTGGDAFFDVTYLTPSCLDDIQIVVVDARDRKVEVSLNSVLGED